MPESLHQIGAPVPFIAFSRFGLINTLSKVKDAPDMQERAQAERKTDPVRWVALRDRRKRLEIGEDCIGVLTGYFCIIRIWKSRV